MSSSRRSKNYAFGGMINSNSAGRADKVPSKVRVGSYVMPADVVSAMGQGNSMAGSATLSKMFKMGPYGTSAPKMKQAKMPRMKFARGGKTPSTEANLSGGEFLVPPEKVAEIGGGDVDYGHEILDALAMEVRRKHINTLQSLPPPRKS